jgi:nucleotide-binding universal stress UspA family protein
MALVIARELAHHAGARLSLHAIVDEAIPGWIGLSVTPSYADALEELMVDRRAAAEELLARRLEACEGVTAEGELVVGDPAGELILASEGLDLLILGSRRWGPVRRLALGSTSERVIRHGACPVLVPPRRVDAEHADALLGALVVAAR